MTRCVGVGALAIAIASGGGCYQGVSGIPDPADDESDSTAGEQVPPECTPPRRLLRLSSYEYVATLEALLGADMTEALAGTLAIVPQDRKGSQYDKQGQELTQQHAQSYFQIAELVGRRIEQDPQLRGRLLPCLVEPDISCIEEFVEDVGPRILRRPLRPGEFERWMELAAAAEGDPVEGLADVIAAMLQSPSFILHLELGEGPLGSHELANRLAYALTGAPPDDPLFAAARDDALSSSQIEEHVARLMESDAARAHVLRFVRQWLALDMVPDLENPPDHVKGTLELEGLNDAAVAELDGLLDHVLFEEGGGLADLLQTQYSVLESESLASLYGVDADDLGPTELGPERAGVLTRVAYLGDPEGHANPLIRGADVIGRFACLSLSPPPLTDEQLADPPIDPESTTRERYEAKTSGPDCSFCHQKINPFGFALEGYDGLGRWRDHEQVFSAEGELLAELPIDDAVDVELDGERTSVRGAAELSAVLASSDEVATCFADQWLKFTEGSVDGATAECDDSSFSTLARDDLRAAIIGYVTSPTFGRRGVAEDEE